MAVAVDGRYLDTIRRGLAFRMALIAGRHRHARMEIVYGMRCPLVTSAGDRP
ncbi:MAG: hypothetical protein R6V62_00475 [Candidatus Fermentibacteraceae bacterium]